MTKQLSAEATDRAIAQKRNLGIGLLIFAAVLCAYLPAINGGLLWDDEAHVTRPELRSWAGLGRIWFELGASQQYYPLLHSAFWIEHRLWGDAVIGYHLVNMLQHATAACLLMLIVRRLFNLDTDPAAKRYAGVDWLAGAIFALHPVGVESVAWISEQKNTLSAVFGLGAALLYLDFDRSRRKSRYWLASVCFGLALLSKTVTATLPAALLVIFWWQRGRLAWRRDVLPLLPWLVLGVAGGLFTAWVEHRFFIVAQNNLSGAGADYSLTLLERGLLAGRVIWFYLGRLVWPANLMFIYPQWSVDAAVWWQYLFPLGALAVVAGLRRIARTHRGPLAGFLVFAGMLFPALGFFNIYPFRYSYVADHFQYLPSLGIIVLVAAGLAMGADFLRRRWVATTHRLMPVAGVILLAILGILTWRQNGMYRDIVTLYRETLARNPNSWMAHSNLGLILAKTPEGLPEALEHFETAVRLKPNNAEVHNHLGSALARTPGRQSEAMTEYKTALSLAPNFPYAHVNLGIALMRVPGRQSEALAHLETAVRLKPDYAEAHYILGRALTVIPGRQAEAIAEYEKALQLNANLADAHSNLAIALVEVPGRMSDAVRHFKAALDLNPGSADAHYNLGYALTQIPGGNREALSHFEAALRIKPDHTMARQWVTRLNGIPP